MLNLVEHDLFREFSRISSILGNFKYLVPEIWLINESPTLSLLTDDQGKINWDVAHIWMNYDYVVLKFYRLHLNLSNFSDIYPIDKILSNCRESSFRMVDFGKIFLAVNPKMNYVSPLLYTNLFEAISFFVELRLIETDGEQLIRINEAITILSELLDSIPTFYMVAPFRNSIKMTLQSDSN